MQPPHLHLKDAPGKKVIYHLTGLEKDAGEILDAEHEEHKNGKVTKSSADVTNDEWLKMYDMIIHHAMTLVGSYTVKEISDKKDPSFVKSVIKGFEEHIKELRLIIKEKKEEDKTLDKIKAMAEIVDDTCTTPQRALDLIEHLLCKLDKKTADKLDKIIQSRKKHE